MVEEKRDSSFAEYQLRGKFIAIGRRYINIFHQLHVLNVGLAALNNDFLSIPDETVELLPELAGGAKLRQHIINLRDGTTSIDKIDPALLPFGAEVFDDKSRYELYTGQTLAKPASSRTGAASGPVQARAAAGVATSARPSLPGNLENDNAKVIFGLLRVYQNTPSELEKFKSMEEVKDFGPEWKARISDMIDASDEADKGALKKVFDGLVTFDYALGIWQECAAISKNPKGVNRDELRARLPEYRKYLLMFGQGGKDMYDRVASVANGG
ncbi:MAG: hypothetical protein LBI17_02715 [Rickettsiales bacterium]|jgi:hypothetical protein|nr:hypothetical protein [Rickettsiales bacterium]